MADGEWGGAITGSVSDFLSEGHTFTGENTFTEYQRFTDNVKMFRDTYGVYEESFVLGIMANFEGYFGTERQANSMGTNDPSTHGRREYPALYVDNIVRPPRAFAETDTTFTSTSVTSDVWEGDLDAVPYASIIDAYSTNGQFSAFVLETNSDTGVVTTTQWKQAGVAGTPNVNGLVLVDWVSKIFAANMLVQKLGDPGDSTDQDMIGFEMDITNPGFNDRGYTGKQVAGFLVQNIGGGTGTTAYIAGGTALGTMCNGFAAYDTEDYGFIANKGIANVTPDYAAFMDNRTDAPVSFKSERLAAAGILTSSKIASEARARFTTFYEGTMAWSNGTDPSDVVLGRVSANILGASGGFQAQLNMTAREGEPSETVIGDLGGGIAGIQLGTNTSIRKIGPDIIGSGPNDVLVASAGLGVGGSEAASTLGTVTAKLELLDDDGVTSIGFIPIYDGIT